MPTVGTSPTVRLGGSLAAGVAVAIVVALSTDIALGVLSGIDCAALVFVVWTVTILWRMSGSETRAFSRREDFRPAVEEAVIVTIAVGGVVTIATLLALSRTNSNVAGAALALAGAFLLWAMLHTMYSARYAHLFYDDPAGGIDFNNSEPPSHRDFLYFSFNLGMTYQVSDTNVGTTALRVVVLRHCILSYIFGLLVLGATINLVSGVVAG